MQTSGGIVSTWETDSRTCGQSSIHRPPGTGRPQYWPQVCGDGGQDREVVGGAGREARQGAEVRGGHLGQGLRRHQPDADPDQRGRSHAHLGIFAGSS